MTGLRKQTFEVNFGQGLDLKTDPKKVIPGKFLALDNATFISPGRISKRNGYTSLTQNIYGGGSISTAAALFTRQNEVLINDGATVYSYDAALTAWVNKGTQRSVTLSPLGAISSQYSLAGYDSAYYVSGAGGLILIAAERWSPTVGTTLAGVVYTIIDAATGSVIVPQTSVSSTSWAPKCIIAGSQFLLYYVDTGPLLKCIRIPVATPSTPDAAVSVTTLVAATALNATVPNYDACYANSKAYVVFGNNVGPTNGLSVFRAAPTAPGTTTESLGIAAVGTTVVNIIGNRNGSIGSQDVVISYCDATLARTTIYSADLGTQQLAPTTLGTTVGALNSIGFCSITAVSLSAVANSLAFYFGFYDTTNTNSKPTREFPTTNTITGAAYGTVGTSSVLVRGVSIAGKAFQVSNVAYLPVTFTVNGPVGPLGYVRAPYSTLFVVDGSGVVCGKAYQTTSAGTYQNANLAGGVQFMLPESQPLQAGSTTVSMAAGYVSAFSVAAKTTFATTDTLYQTVAVSVCLWNFNDTTNVFQRGELAGSVLIGSANPSMYDGAKTVEMGFAHPPFAITNVIVGGGAGSINAGVHQYAVCYEWPDQQGLLHRSAPSVPISVTNAANDVSNTLTIPTLRLTQKTNVLITVYRTAANGSIFYKITNTGSASDALYNSTTADNVSWADTRADSLITSNVQLYTTGGVLQNDPPPPCSAVCVHRNRVFLVDAQNPLSIWYSQLVVPGRPVQFSSFQTLNADPGGGPLTALASLDGNLIEFKGDRIFYQPGQGPDQTGGQNDYTDPLPVTSDTGCTTPKAIAMMPDGLMFQGAKGIYLLSRGLGVGYIGWSVEQAPTAPLTCTSAVLMPYTTQVRFGTSGNTIYVYDYFGKQWSTFSTTAFGGLLGAIDGCLWRGAAVGSQYVLLDAGGAARQEVVGSFGDDGTHITLSATTSWLQLAGVQGFQRIYEALVLGEYYSAHTLTVTVRWNFSTSNPQTIAWTGSSVVPYQVRLFPSKQKCEAIQFVLTETGTGSGQGVSLTGLTLELGLKQGAFRVPPTYSAG